MKEYNWKHNYSSTMLSVIASTDQDAEYVFRRLLKPRIRREFTRSHANEIYEQGGLNRTFKVRRSLETD